MREKISVWDYIFLARPILLIPVWAFFLLGYLKSGGNRFCLPNQTILTLIVVTLFTAILYIINQIFDQKSDAINRKHLLIAEKIIPPRIACLEIIFLAIIAFPLSIRLPAHIIIFIILSFLLGILYSLPPLKLKAVPFADFLINGIGYGFLNFSLGYLTNAQFSPRTILLSLPYFFAVIAIFINTTVLDIDGDRECGYLTTGVFLGRKNSPRFASLLIIACIIIAIVIKDYICLIPALVSSPLFLLAGVDGNENYIKLSIRIGGPLFILVVGIVFPYFLILSILILIFLRIYYKKKFGIVYPSL